MGKRSFSTTMDGETLKALKLYAVKQDRALNDVLEEEAAAYLAQKATENPDAAIFVRRAHEPIEDCLAAIEQRLSSKKDESTYK